MKTLLEAKGISKIYDTGGNTFEALKDIHLQVKEGEVIGIMGPSDSGKTTLLNVLSTIDAASKGKILIDGKDIVKMLFYENMLMGLLSLVIGIVMGSLLSKGFLKLLVNMLELNVNVHFEVPIGVVIDTAVIFCLTFL